MSRAKKTLVIPVPKVTERGGMPKPTRVFPNPTKAAAKTACRKKMTREENRGNG